MQRPVTDPLGQERIVSEFLATQTAIKRRSAQLRNARFGPPWVFVGLAGLTWGFVAAGWMVDLTTIGGRLVLGAFPLAMFLLTIPLFRGIARRREELLLGIIEEEAPYAYQWLKQQKFMLSQPPGPTPPSVADRAGARSAPAGSAAQL